MMAQNLIEGIMQETKRVREIINIYEHPDQNGSGAFAAMMMKMDIEAAEKAVSSGDTIAMISAYGKLKDYEL